MADEAGEPFRIDVHHHIAPPLYRAELVARKVGPRHMLDWTPESLSPIWIDRGSPPPSPRSPSPGFGSETMPRPASSPGNATNMRRGLGPTIPAALASSLRSPCPTSKPASARSNIRSMSSRRTASFYIRATARPIWARPNSTRSWRSLDRRKAVVFTHPRRIDCLQDIIPDVPASTIEFGAEISRAAANLVFGGTTTRYPSIRFILPHAGGTVPFLIERFLVNAARPDIAARVPRGVRHELRKFHYDIAQAANRGPLVLAARSGARFAAFVRHGFSIPRRRRSGHGSHPVRLIRCGRSHGGRARQRAAIAAGTKIAATPRRKIGQTDGGAGPLPGLALS